MPTAHSAATQAFRRTLTRNLILPLAMSALLVTLFLYVVFDVNRTNQTLADQDAILENQSDLLRIIVDSETGLRGYLVTGMDEYLRPYNEARAVVDDNLQNLAASFRDRPQQAIRLAELRRLMNEWFAFCERSIKARRSGSMPKLTDGMTADQLLRKDLMDNVRRQFAEIRKVSIQKRADLAADASFRVRLIAAAAALFTILLGGFLAYVGRRQLMGLSEAFENALRASAAQNEELKRQGWIRSGQAHLAENLRGELNVSELGSRLLSYLAEYTGAQIGALYVNDGPDYLVRVAQFAYPEGYAAKERFRYGQGLVGQVAREKKLSQLTNLPSDYVKVTSGTGEALPRAMVLAPLTADGLTQGVLELGFLQGASPESQALLTEASELMGVAIRSVSYRERLQQLLTESQQQSEELQAQQEELRVSNEELEERTRVLQETQAKLESQHAELEQTNEQLEEQATLLEEQKRSLDHSNRVLIDSQTALAQKASEIENASRYKSEFLANMSHELRTPLNSSIILAKLLKDNPDGNLSKEQVEFAETIHGAGNDLLALINDILDLSKVESGKLEIQPEQTAVSAFLDNLDRTFQPVAREKNLRLVLKTEPGAPATLITDPRRVEQILKNLVSNALKFTSKGDVEVTVHRRDKGIAFRVKDSGIGIAPSQQQVIFEAFRQADGTTSRKYGGTGLGLSISKNLAEILGGTIEVDSALGQGSTFTLWLPLEIKGAAELSTPSMAQLPSQDAAPAAAPAPRVPLRSHEHPAPAAPRPRNAEPLIQDDRAQMKPKMAKTLLVVEDELQYAKIIFQAAKERNFLCAVAADTDEGFRLAKQLCPSAILLDIRLPDGSGLSLLDRLKYDPDTRHIHVHGMSVADYSREALHMGAAGFALKAADLEEIRHTIAMLEEKTRSRSRRVLLVEDDATQRASVERLIGSKGVEIVSASTGGEALTALHNSLFDCMIIDLKLPDMTGFELLEKMARTTGSPVPPVIVYTGKDLSRAEEQALYRHSRTIIIKGARSPERLLDEVTLFLHQAEADLSPERQKMLRASRNRERAFEGRTILLVDDDVRNIFALSSALELKGANVKIARNGREAVDKVLNEEAIDIVLMDVMMPEMDGLEATQLIRKSGKHDDLPIIAVTAKAMQDDYEKCLQAGANDYLAKPVDVDKLVSLIRVWLPKHLGKA